jgi:hypothetical protein
MKREIFDTLPYISRKELIELRSYFKVAFEANTHLIHEDNVDSVLYQFRDHTNQYAFNIKDLRFDAGKKINFYIVYFNPESLTTIAGSSRTNTFSQIKESFSRWIDNVRKMYEVTEEYYDPDKKFYNEQFADYFTNDDEDSAINPFEIERQEILYYFLTYAEKTIIKSTDIDEEQKKDLIIEISQLQKDIPNLSKKRFVSALSKFAQKAKKVSNKLFHEIFDVLKKEVIKKFLYEGADQIPNALHAIEKWLNLLN